MGLLGRLFGSKPTFEDRVWMTEELKLGDIVRRVDGGTHLIVYHFGDTADRLRARLEEAEVDYNPLKRPGTDELERLSRVALLDSEPLSHPMISGAVRSAQKQINKKRRNLENYARSSAEWMQLNMSE